MKITFLGTSAMIPTIKRNHPSVLLVHEGDYLLFDCGEGTQRQMIKAKISTAKIGYIFITHWHGDHCLGIPGMLHSMNTNQKQDKVIIFGPKGAKEKIEMMISAFAWRNRLEVEVKEIKNDLVHETDNWEVYCMPVKHTTHAVSYYFKEKDKLRINLEYTKKFGLIQHPLLGKLQKGKTITWKGNKITPAKGTIKKIGKKVTYVMDTLYLESLEKFANDSDLLICEAMFTDSGKEMADEKLHMTAKQAGKLAKKSKSKQLYLMHMSQRHSKREILEDAKKVFPEAKIAEDFMEVKLT